MKLFSLNKEYFFNLFYNYLYPQMCMKNAKILYIMKYFDFPKASDFYYNH